MHSLLAHQLDKLGLADSAGAPSRGAWLALLERVDQSYTEADRDRAGCAREMHELSVSLGEERDRLTAILNSLGDGLCALDSEGRLLLINPQGRAACSAGMPTSSSAATCSPRSGRHRPVAWPGRRLPALVGAGQTYRNEDDSFVCQDGTRLPVSYVVTPLAAHGSSFGRGARLSRHDHAQAAAGGADAARPT